MSVEVSSGVEAEDASGVASLLHLIKSNLKDLPKMIQELLPRILEKTRGKEFQVGAGLLLIGTNLYYYRKFTYWSRRNVKNPPPLPIVGNFLSLILFQYQSLSLGWLRKYGKVYGFYSGSTPQLIIADAKVVKQICIKDFDKFPNHQFFRVPNKYQRNFLIVQKDDYWRSMRAIISPTFTSGRMKVIYKILSQCADDMVELLHNKLEEEGHSSTVINSRAATGALSMGSAVGSFYGIKLNDNGPEDHLSKQYFSRRSAAALSPSMWNMATLAVIPSAVAQLFQIPDFSPTRFDFFFEKAKTIVSRRLKSKESQNDYLQLLLEARADRDLDDFDVERHSDHYTLNNDEQQVSRQASAGGRPSKLKLSEWEVACQVVMLMLVATETTAALISHVIFLLAHHKDIQRKLYEELATIRRREGETGRVGFEYDDVVSHQYLDCVISETLRLMSPALRMDRKANMDYLIVDYGILVPKDMVVYIDFNALHNNPEYWTEPDRFIPDRFSAENKHKIVPGSYCPFGIGPRACIGFRFALTEAKVAVAKLVNEFEFDKVEGQAYPAVPEKPVFIGTLYKDLRVSLKSRR